MDLLHVACCLCPGLMCSNNSIRSFGEQTHHMFIRACACPFVSSARCASDSQLSLLLQPPDQAHPCYCCHCCRCCCSGTSAPYNGYWDPCPLLTAAYPCSLGPLSRVEVWNRAEAGAASPCSNSCKARIDNFDMDVVMNNQLVTTYSFSSGSTTVAYNIAVPLPSPSS